MKFKVPPSFQPPELLRRFARLPLTCEAIGVFANKFGFLGKPLFVCYPPAANRSKDFLWGESFYFWKEQIEQVKFLLDIWDAIQTEEMSGDSGLLKRCIVWNRLGEPKSVGIHWLAPKRGGSIIASELISSQKEILQQWKHNELVNPARYYLNRQIDDQLKNHIELFISDDGMYVEFDSLLAALYSAFKWEVLGKGLLPMLCPHCGKVFTPERRNQKFHNESCQKAAWDKKNREKAKTNL
jgi:hypothetical protein